jgi:hypothetical protein
LHPDRIELRPSLQARDAHLEMSATAFSHPKHEKQFLTSLLAQDRKIPCSAPPLYCRSPFRFSKNFPPPWLNLFSCCPV